jgi:hypothetical protein
MTDQAETQLAGIGHNCPPEPICDFENPDAIMTFGTWARLAGISTRQAKRLRQIGQGPRCVRLGSRKLGVTVAEHRRWTKSRLERA